MSSIILAIMLASPDAAAILHAMDARTFHRTASQVMTIQLHRGKKTITKKIHSWTMGKSLAYIEFLNRRDRDTRYLKRVNEKGDMELWLYSAEEDEALRISGHMLRRGFAGSDFSNEDAVENTNLSDNYIPVLDATTSVTVFEKVHQCHILTLTLKKGVRSSYAKRRLWVDTRLDAPRRVELYGVSGRLMRVMEIGDYRMVNGIPVAFKMKIFDPRTLKRKYTMILMESVRLDVALPKNMFTLQYLRR